MKILTFFVNFWLNQIRNCFVQIKKMKDGIFSFQMKKNYFCHTLADDARHENVPPPLDWLESWSHTIKGMIKENSWKNRSNQYHMRQIAWLDWSKTAKHFSVNSCEKFLSWQVASRRAGKQASGFHPSDRYFSFFWVVISTMHVVLFILGKCLLDSNQLYIFYIYRSLARQLSWITVS